MQGRGTFQTNRMNLLRKLLKWLLIVVLVLALGVVAFVWGVLEVNPFEGDVDHLWELVSNEVDFFVRFPGTALLHEDLAVDLSDQEGYYQLAEMREDLADLTKRVAEQVHIPVFDIKVNAEKDFLGTEMAIAGTMQTDFSQLRFDNFMVLTRVKWYARFISALKREFVRKRVPDSDRISVEKGYYFRIELDEAATKELSKFRSQMARAQEPNVVYLGRIKDVLILSDNHVWIEAAIRGRAETLPADTYFDTEFIRNAREGNSIELFMRPILSANLMIHHGRDETNGPLAAVRRFVPVPMTGEVTVLAKPDATGIDLTISDNPPGDGFSKVKELHLTNIYEAEKADLRIDLSENGIARFIPRERTVGAVVLHAKADDLVGLLLSFIPPSDRQLLEDEARRRGYRRGFEILLRNELFADMDETHMLIVHRPPEFEKANLATYRDPPDVWPPTPEGQFTFSIVCRVRDGVAPDKVRSNITRNLPYLGLVPLRPDKNGKFHRAEPETEAADLDLLKPTYGQLLDTPYIVFSGSVSAANDILRAATDPETRLIADPVVQDAIGRLPREGTLALILRGGVLASALGDHVRAYAAPLLEQEKPKMRARIKQQYPKKGKDETWVDEQVERDFERYVALRYPELAEQYRHNLAWLRALDTAAAVWKLGIGPTKQVRGWATLRFDTRAVE